MKLGPNLDQGIERRIMDASIRRPIFDWKELYQYRDLFYFLIWRDIKGMYAQSVLGIGWAIIQPLFNMIVFTIVFGKLANINSDGVPYAIFSFTALVPWTYFAGTLSASATSLISASNLLTKVYFPRLIVPIVPALSKLVDFGIAFIILFGLMLWFRATPNIGIIFLPLLMLLMILTAVGLGMWLTSLSVQYRDIKHGLSFGIQLIMYLSPVVYPVSSVPESFRLLYGINPMVSVIEGFRSALLGTVSMPLDLIGIGGISATIIAITGILYFRRMERIFADVV